MKDLPSDTITDLRAENARWKAARAVDAARIATLEKMTSQMREALTAAWPIVEEECPPQCDHAVCERNRIALALVVAALDASRPT